MDVTGLQVRLADRACDPGPVDGVYGARTRAALMRALVTRDPRPPSMAEMAAAAQSIGCTAAHLMAIRSVEASGAGFSADGRPVLLFEPHRFSRATGGRFDDSHPAVSYRPWDRARYPATQAGRYLQLIEAVGLDVDAGFASASYGAFQILGENHSACGYASPFAFAMGQADSEAEQLRSLVRFLDARSLDVALRRCDWPAFALGYNGTGYRLNRYDERLAAAHARATRVAA